MFVIRNVPIVIEPVIGAVESELVRIDKNSTPEKILCVQLLRLPLAAPVMQFLPFVPDIQMPHVFSTTLDPKRLSLLLVYDSLGRLATVYSKPDGKKSVWDKYAVAEEHSGKTAVHHSVRFSFKSEKSRNVFVSSIEHLLVALASGAEVPQATLKSALRLLQRSRISPVMLPVAVAKAEHKKTDKDGMPI